MSGSKGKVFIVWGGNRDLAEAVKKELRSKEWDAQIGGGDNDTKPSNFHLPTEILNQLKSASRAILLIQGTGSSKKAVSFRPNLMFEWGFLASRLESDYLHEFVIDIDNRQLPSDLLGRWVVPLHSGAVDAMARQIAAEFLKGVRQTPINPLEVFKSSQKWWYWIRGVLDKKEPPDNLRLAEVLLHGIQPAFYLGQLTFLSHLISKLRPPYIHDISDELIDAKTIAAQACRFYTLICALPQINEKDMDDVNQALAADLRCNSESGILFYWLSAIRDNFLGLSHFELAKLYDRRGERKVFCGPLQ